MVALYAYNRYELCYTYEINSIMLFLFLSFNYKQHTLKLWVVIENLFCSVVVLRAWFVHPWRRSVPAPQMAQPGQFTLASGLPKHVLSTACPAYISSLKKKWLTPLQYIMLVMIIMYSMRHIKTKVLIVFWNHIDSETTLLHTHSFNLAIGFVRQAVM